MPYFCLSNLLDKCPILTPLHDTIPVIDTHRSSLPFPSSFSTPSPIAILLSRRRVRTPLHHAPMHRTVFRLFDSHIDPLQTPLGTALMIRTEPRLPNPSPSSTRRNMVSPLGASYLCTGMLRTKRLRAPLAPLLGTIPHRTVVRATVGGRLRVFARMASSGATLAGTRTMEITKRDHSIMVIIIIITIRGHISSCCCHSGDGRKSKRLWGEGRGKEERRGRRREGVARRKGTSVLVAKGGGIFDLAGTIADRLEAPVLGTAGDAFAGSRVGAGWVGAAIWKAGSVGMR